MVRPTLIDLNPVELKYYPLKCSESCNVLSPKICFPKKTKCINIFNITIEKHISCDGKCNSTTCNSNKKWNNITCQ